MIPEKQWLEPEKWVWQEVRASRTADFNKDLGTDLDPTTPEGWGDERKLRCDFLKQILLRQPHSTEIPAEGVRIVGAWFPEEIELGHARLLRQLWLERCRFEKWADLDGLQIDGWFSLEGSAFAGARDDGKSVSMNGARINGHVSLSSATFQGLDLTSVRIGGQLALGGSRFDAKLDMNGIDVAQHLLMADKSEFKDVELTGARIGGKLSLAGAVVDGELDMNELQVGHDLVMSESKLKDVKLVGARISGLIDMSDATLDGNLEMAGIEITRHLFVKGSATTAAFKDVQLRGARIGGALEMTEATFDGEVDLENIRVDGGGFLRQSTFAKKVTMIFSRCGGNLDISDSKFNELDLTGTRIEGELRLGSFHHKMTKWLNEVPLSLNLRNVHVGALQDRRDRVDPSEEGRSRWQDAWPDQIQLDGFTYDRLGGFGGNSDTDSPNTDVDMQSREVGWYINWLDRDRSYTPQPYDQLARAFRAAGEPAKADRILYESRKRARSEAKRHGHYSTWLGSSFLNMTIGYGIGIRYFRALLWVIAFTAVGTAVLYLFAHPNDGFANAGFFGRFFYSLDQLLPIVEFEKYEGVVLARTAAYYFYVQKILGWVLGSFLVAGLAGLTQKQ